MKNPTYKISGRTQRYALRPIAYSVMLACVGGASANPVGPKVAAGAATFQANGDTLSVTNAPGTIINWQSFSIGAGERTRFLQQAASSAVLNRVVGSDASSILGALSSNGRVFLVNPHGIVFGAGARIDTAGFIASTLNISDRDFLQGKLKFEGGGNGVLRNEGVIRASGDIMLVGPAIENAGIIRSESGSVLLAAGRSVTITSPDAQGVKFALQAPEDTALNVGSIEAASAAAMFAGTLVHSGDIRANVATENGGRVVLVAQKDATIEKGALVSASGSNGGSVTVQSGDTTMVAGRLEARGDQGRGGAIGILGNRVALTAGASIDASGETGGGTILVGGDYQGANASVQNARRTHVGPDTLLRADAGTSGDGGRVIVWADGDTRFHGNVSARGGAQSGDGGFVETSGKESLTVSGALVDTRAPAGRTGTWLLDPANVKTVAMGQGTAVPGAFMDNAPGDDAIDPTSSINGSLSDVVIQASNDITISVDAPIDMTNAGISFTAQAGRSIFLDSFIRTNDGAVTLRANETGDAGVVPLFRVPGPAILRMAPGLGIVAGAANVTLRMNPGTGHDGTSGDIVVGNLSGGNINIVHLGPTAGSRILFNDAAILSAAALTFGGTKPVVFEGGVVLNTLVPVVANTSLLVPGGGVVSFNGGVTVNNELAVLGGTLNAAGIENNGAVTLMGGALNTSGVVNINPGRTFTLAGGAFTPTGPVNNAGILGVAAGSFALPTDGAHTGAFNVADGAMLSFTGGTQTLSGVALNGAGTFTNAGAALNVTGNSAANGAVFTQSAGSLNLGAGTTFTKNTGIFNWAGGAITGTGTLAMSGASLALAGAGTRTLNGPTVNVSSLDVTDSNLTLAGGALNVAAAVTISGTGTLQVDNGTFAPSGAFHNNGTFNLNAGTVNLGAGGSDTGAFNIAAGATLGFTAGTHNLNAGSSVGGAGNVVVGGGVFTSTTPITTTGALTVSGGAANFEANGTALTPSSVTVSGGGTANFNRALTDGGSLTILGGRANFNVDSTVAGGLTLSGGLVSGSATLRLNGNDNTWASGTMSGPGTTFLGNGNTLSITGTGNMFFTGRTLTTDGPVKWSDGVISASGGVFNNNAGLDIQGNVAWNQVTGAAPTVINNAGGITRSAGTGVAALNHAIVTGPGPINVQAGTLRLSSSAGAAVGALSGAVTIAAGAALDFAGGTYNLSGGATISGAGGNLIVSGSTLTTALPVTTTGALTVSGGAANFDANGTALTPASVTVSGGTASFNRTLSDAGALSISGGVANINAASTVATGGSLSGGTLGGSSTLTVNGGTFDWTGGDLNGTGTLAIAPGAGLNIRSNAMRTMNGGYTVDNSGTVTWTDAGEVRADNSANVVINRAAWNAQNNSNLSTLPTAAGTIAFTNAAGATLTKSGNGTSGFTGATAFSNAGTVSVTGGTLLAPLFVTNTGAINIGDGAALTAGALTNADTGTIGGSGTLNVPMLTNNGILRPGAAGGGIGTLSISGNLAQGASGSINVETAGPGPGSSDVVAVTGAAQLGGTLNLTHLNGFLPPSDSAYTVMTFASSTGDFATKTFPAGYNTFYSAAPTPLGAPTSYVLSLGTVINAWTGTTGTWQTPGNWSLGHVPTSGEDALINVSPLVTETVTVSAGSQNARRMTSFENITVAGGGELTLGPLNSTVNAALAVAGGTLNAAGPLAANALTLSSGTLDARFGTLAALNMTGGTLSRSVGGDLTILGPFVASGGTIAPSAGAGRFITAGSSTISGVTTSRDWLNAGLLDLNGTLTLSGANFTNAQLGTAQLGTPQSGTLRVNPGGLMDLAGARLTNNGTLILNGADATPFGANVGGPIVNAGTLTKEMAGTVDLVHPFENLFTGTINVNGGTLRVPFGGVQAGRIEIGAGARLNTDGALINTADGVIGGLGRIALPGGAQLTNSGTLRPGLRPGATGTLTVEGDFVNTPGAGRVVIRLGGQADGQFDKLMVTGTANLGGTLSLFTTPTYIAADGDTFTLINAGTVVNDFGVIVKPFGNGINILNRPSFYLIALGSPTANSWIFDTSGNWNDASRWSLGHVPLANEQAFINRPTNLSVTVPAGTFAADSLQSRENIFIDGTLGLANASLIAAQLSITPGGVLQGAGPVTVNGMSINAGRIASTGGVTVTGVTGPLGAWEISGGLTVNEFQMINGGSLSIPAGGVLNFAGAAVKRVGDGTANAPVINNAGTIRLAGSNLVLDGGNVNIAATGKFEILGNVGIQSTGGPLSTVDNAGTIVKTGGGTSTIGIGPNPLRLISNNGVFDAQTGTFELATVFNTFNNGTRFIGTGVNAVTNNSTFNGTITSNGLTLQSGDFAGNASFAGTTTWTGGRMTGVFTVPAGATLNLTGAGAKAIDGAAASLTSSGTLNIGGNGPLTLSNGAALTNAGVATWNGGTGSTTINASSTLTNSGTFNLNASVTDTGVIGAGTFQNNGTLNSTAAGINTLISAVFNNAGRVNVDGGTLRLTGNGTDTGAYALDAATTLDLSGGVRNLTAGSSLTGAGMLAVSGGTMTVNGPAATNNTTVSGGTATFNANVAGAGTFTVTGTGTAVVNAAYSAGTTTISGGTTSFNGAAPHTTGTLNLSGGTLGGTGNLTVTTGGTWSGGAVSGAGASLTIANGTTFNVTGDTGRIVDAATLTNAGTVNLAGVGNLVLNNGATLNNSGTLDVQTDADIRNTAGGAAFANTGTVRKSAGGGTSTIGNPIALTNSGTFDVLSGTMEFASNSGTFNNGTQFTGTGTKVVTGNSTFNGTITSNGLTLQSGDFAGNATFAGTTTWTGGRMTGVFAVPAGARLNLAGAGAKTIDTIAGGAASLTNSGALIIADNGTLTLSNGAALTNAGVATWNGGTGSTTINGNSTLTNSATGTFNLNASVADTGVTGAGTFQNNGTLNSTAAGVNTLISTAFNNAGRVNVDGGTLRLTGNGTDTGAYAIDAGTTLDFAAGMRALNAGSSVTGPGTLAVSGGMLNANAVYGASATTIAGGTANFNGNVAGAGTVAVTGGTANVNAGYQATTTTISAGAANFNGAAAHTTNTLNLSGGTLGGTGDLTVTTGGTWSGGGVSGAGASLTIANGAAFNLTGDTGRIVDAATLTNAGTVNLAGAGNLVLNNGATLNNSGTLDVQSDADILNTAGGATLANAGTLRKSGGAGTTMLGSNGAFTLSNAAAATIEVQSGTLQTAGGFPLNAGTIAVAAGTTFATSAAPLTNAGTVRGAGMLNLGGATFTNNAIVAPGTPADNTSTLVIAGNLTQGAAGRVDIELGGTGAGQFDALTVIGTAALAGTLGLSTTGGYAPAVGDTFNILTTGTRTGNFGTTTKTFANEVIPTYAATSVSLQLGTTTGNTWIFDVSDNWNAPQRWSQGRVPLATDQVVIDRPAGVFTVTVPAGEFSADTLRSTENVTLAGALALAKASSVTATLAVNGGTLQGAAPVTVNGTLALNGGTIANTGGVTVNGNTAVTGGVSRLTSALTADAFALTSGGLTVSAGGVLNLAGASPEAITGGTLTNMGTVNLGGNADMTLSGGAVFENFGIANLGGSARIVLAGDGAASLVNRGGGTIADTTSSALPITVAGAPRANKSFVNAGTFTKNAGAAGVQMLDVPMTNTGTLDVLAGTLIVNGLPTNNGVIDVRAGTTFSTAGAALANGGPGLLKGDGTLDVGGATFTNNGTVAPGRSPGTLTIAGNYAQGPGGILAIEVGGTVPGIDYDLLKVTGNAVLGGTLFVTTADGKTIVAGTAYDFMTYASRTGDFSSFVIPVGSTFVATPGPTSYRFAAPTPQQTIVELTALAQNDAIVLSDRAINNPTQQNPASGEEDKKLEQECR